MNAQQSAFTNQVMSINDYLEHLQMLSNDHFNKSPDGVNWSDVSSFQYVATQLRGIVEFLNA